MDISPIAFAIPVFFVLIGLELLIAKLRKMEVYQYHDTITDLSCGVGSVILGAATKTVDLLAYTLVYEAFAFFELGSSIPVWIAVFIGVDFLFYWFHRASHRVNALWAGHVVHHQSEEYNLSVALRQAWYLPLIEWVFYIPLAIIGFSPLLYFTAKTLNLLYQFWIHTQLVRSLGPLEWVFNTPSHHRAHHGQNPEYIDTNYGGILIVWDRMFGSFVKEDEPVVYGTIDPAESWNPLWLNLVHWRKIWRRVRDSESVSHAVHIIFGPPGWTPEGELVCPDISRQDQNKFETQTSRKLDIYVGLNYLLAIVATTVFMINENVLSWQKLSAIGGVVLLGLIAWGGLFESRKWALGLEALRIIVTPIAFYLVFPIPALGIGLVLISAISLMWIRGFRTPRVAESPV